MIYTVLEGDNLYSIANKFNTTPQALMYINDLHNTILQVGDKLWIHRPKEEKEQTQYTSYDEFLNDNKGVGNLKVQVYMARGIFPIENAEVHVSKLIGNDTVTFYKGLTNESGMVNHIMLPTVIPDSDDPQMTTYLVEAWHKDYLEKEPQIAIIYNDVKSVVTIEMFPKEKRYDK